MPLIRRREFLPLLLSPAAFARTLNPVGVQLYTVRDVLPEKPLETLQALEKIGFRELEAVANSLNRIGPSLRQTSLKRVSLHLDTALFMRDLNKLPPALDEAKRYGFKFVVCPYVAPADRGGVDVIRKLGDTLNKAGTLCKNAGLRLCYHNHAFEFAPFENGTLLDELMRVADPGLVGLELDIMWAQVAGVDPVSVLKRYHKRVPLIHLKNVQEGVPRRFDEGIPRTAFREVGKGAIDIPAVLKAAKAAGVQHYFVEQDQTPGDPLVSLRESFDYLRTASY